MGPSELTHSWWARLCLTKQQSTCYRLSQGLSPERRVRCAYFILNSGPFPIKVLYSKPQTAPIKSRDSQSSTRPPTTGFNPTIFEVKKPSKQEAAIRPKNSTSVSREQDPPSRPKSAVPRAPVSNRPPKPKKEVSPPKPKVDIPHAGNCLKGQYNKKEFNKKAAELVRAEKLEEQKKQQEAAYLKER